jgi:hypothetical protein
MLASTEEGALTKKKEGKRKKEKGWRMRRACVFVCLSKSFRNHLTFYRLRLGYNLVLYPLHYRI